MELMRRALAPITAAAWKEIDDEAVRVLRTALTARRIVDVDGPHGIAHGAVSLGRLDVKTEEPVEGVRIGVNQVLPLIEARAELELDSWELDNLERGAEDIDLTALHRAAESLAELEERAVYEGLEAAGIVGLAQATEHDVRRLPSDASAWMDVLAQARVQLGRHHVEGPYHLILGPTAYRVLMSGAAGDYPLHRRVKDLLGGDIHLARHAGGGFLLSERGGDAKLTLGQDISVGFHDRVGTSLHLFLTESFTFRVLAPEAVICFSLEG